ncbi:MAG: hypothetical protein PHF24_09255 [Syntrophomonas sp.]|nr:hypothetical protein [Syntrophomonas sp.]
MTREKGIVLEVGEKWAIVLTQQGKYKRIKTKDFLQVGEIWQEPTGYLMRYALVAAILLVLLGAGFSFLPVTAYAQISSGVELGLNRWEMVVTTRPLNDEGSQLLQEVSLKGKTLEKAVEVIVDKTLAKSDADNKDIAVNVVTKKPNDEQNRQRMIEKMDTKIKRVLEQYNQKSSINKGFSAPEKDKLDNKGDRPGIKANNEDRPGKEDKGKPGSNKNDPQQGNQGNNNKGINNNIKQRKDKEAEKYPPSNGIWQNFKSKKDADQTKEDKEILKYFERKEKDNIDRAKDKNNNGNNENRGNNKDNNRQNNK